MTDPAADPSVVVQFEVRGVDLDAAARRQLDRDLAVLRDVARSFPVAALHVEIVRHPRSGDFHVKTSLRLTRQAPLFTGDRDRALHPAFKRCVRKLVEKVEAYKASLGERGPEPGPVLGGRKVSAAAEPSTERMAEAVAQGDYPAFRREVGVYQDALSRRIGRWIERYPDAAAMLGDELLITEIVEEVFLNAFDRFERRPAPPETFAEWLESLIDPSIRCILEDPEREKENIAYIRTISSP